MPIVTLPSRARRSWSITSETCGLCILLSVACGLDQSGSRTACGLNVAGEQENCSLGVVKRCYGLLTLRKFTARAPPMTATDKTYGRVGQSKASMVEWDNLPGSAAFHAPYSSTTVITDCKKCGYFSDCKAFRSRCCSGTDGGNFLQFLSKKGSWTAANAVQ